MHQLLFPGLGSALAMRSRESALPCMVVVVGMVVLPTIPVPALVLGVPRRLGCELHLLQRGSPLLMHPVVVLLLVVVAVRLTYVVILAAQLVFAVSLLLVVAALLCCCMRFC